MSTVEYIHIEKVPLTDFVDDLLYDITDLPEDAALHFIKRAAIEMARKGNIVRREAIIHTQDFVENYVLEPPDCADIVAIMSVCAIKHSLCSEVTRLTAAPCRLPCGTYSWFTEPNEIHFSPGKYGNAYRVNFSVAPQIADCELDSVYLRHTETLLLGAKAYVYELNDKPWTNRGLAQKLKEQFKLGISKAAVEKMLGGQRGVMRVKRPWVIR